jgi:hypothetical protein
VTFAIVKAYGGMMAALIKATHCRLAAGMCSVTTGHLHVAITQAKTPAV